ncbi:MAG TPA: permease prefix domain 1-containing protein [Terriglobia bacterium]|nr:permease prefix domain 1-containing protein [Terriglobia bacterium]
MIHDLLYRMRAVLWRRAMEAELDEELRSHLEHQAEKHLRSGLSREEAERRARFDFGDLDQVKNECRISWGVRLIDELAAEVRAGLHQARRKPVFSTVSALTLVLGLLANTMMFNGLTSVVERLSPHQQQASPVLAAQNSAPPPVNRSDIYSGLAVRKGPSKKASRVRPSPRLRENHPENVASAACRERAFVTAAFFLTPGVDRISAARWMLREAEDNRNHFVLISRTWQQARPGAGLEGLEMTLHSGGATYTVVEVISGNPEYPQQEGWTPLVLNARAAMSNSAQWGVLAVMEQPGQCVSISESLSSL